MYLLPDGETSAIGCNAEFNEVVKRIIIVFKIIVNRLHCLHCRVTDVRRRVVGRGGRVGGRVTDVRRRVVGRGGRRVGGRVTDCVVCLCLGRGCLHWCVHCSCCV